MNINNLIDKDKYLSRFKVYYSQTLFPPYWENLLVSKCPLCGNNLHFPLQGKTVVCNSKKHLRFIINRNKLKELTERNKCI